MALNYDYRASKAYCEQLGLVWADGIVDAADADAKSFGMSQEQVDVMMRHHLWNVKHLFDPLAYHWKQRIKIALWFLFGRFS